jgi:hypothetical protein
VRDWILLLWWLAIATATIFLLNGASSLVWGRPAPTPLAVGAGLAAMLWASSRLDRR